MTDPYDKNPLSEDFLTPHDYETALHAQTACNLSGIVHAFSAVLHKIWNEVRRDGKGTLGVNQHPICRLYAEQITHLSGGNTTDDGSYNKAYYICQERAKAPVQ